MTVSPAYVVPGLVSLILVPLLFSVLGASEYGEWILIYGIAAGVPQLTSTWLETSTVRFGHRRPFDRRSVILALGGTIAAGAFVAALLIPGLGALGVLITALYTGTIASYVLSIARLQSQMRFGSLASTAVLRSVLAAAFALVGGVIGGTAPAVALGSTAGYALGVATAWAAARRRSPRAVPALSAGSREGAVAGPRGGSSLESAQKFVRPELTRTFATASAIIAVGFFVLSVGDRFILSFFWPLEEVGVYAATYAIVDLAGRLLPSIVLVTIRPRIYRAIDLGDLGLGRELVADAALVLAWAGAGISVCLLALAMMGVPLPIAPDLVGPIAAGLTAMTVANAAGILYTAVGRQGHLAAIVTSVAVISIGLDLALIPALGARGAALVTAIVYAIQVALTVIGLRPGPAPARSRRLFVAASVIGSCGATATISWFQLPGVSLLVPVALLAFAAPALHPVARRLVVRRAWAGGSPPKGPDAPGQRP